MDKQTLSKEEAIILINLVKEIEEEKEQVFSRITCRKVFDMFMVMVIVGVLVFANVAPVAVNLLENKNHS